MRARVEEGKAPLARCVLALGPDTAGRLLAELIDRAQRRLDVAVYELGPGYAGRVARAAERGVAVRALLDAHAGANATAAGVLGAGAAACRVLGGHRGAEAHWKVLIADDVMAVGSGNLIRRDAPPPGTAGTREWWVAVSDGAALLGQAAAALDAAWAEASAPAWRPGAAVPVAPPVGVPHPAVPSLSLDVDPRCLHLGVGGAEVAALLGAQLRGAARRALVTVPYVHTHVATVRELLDLLAAAGGRLLLGTPPDPADAAALRATPLLHARVMDPARCTTGHAKGMVADGVAVVGSANWSAAGLGGNREAALAIADDRAADWFAAALERDWEVSSPLR
jgi:phosphatidylserine/phosphatidylglycerophosphate/cardiolipin synthase-like enzyme